jgi:PHD/YefM family antitoxin component YafN of YafNO toxin-antitoxin module
MKSYSVEKAKANFDELLKRVTENDEPARIIRGRKLVAAVIPAGEFEFLNAIIHKFEDIIDAREAEKAMKEYRRNPKSVVPLDTFEKDLGL